MENLDTRAVLRKYIEAIGLTDAVGTASVDVTNAEAVAESCATQIAGGANAPLAFRLIQVLCVDPGAAGASGRTCVRTVLELLRAAHPVAAKGDTAVPWCQAVAMAVLTASLAGSSLLRELVVICQVSLRAAGARTGPGYVDSLLQRARVGYEADRAAAALQEPLQEVTMQTNLLWWAESAWSPSRKQTYDEIPVEKRGIRMAADYGQLAPRTEAASAFLCRTLRREGVSLEGEARVAELCARITPPTKPPHWTGRDSEFVRGDATALPIHAVAIGVSIADPDQVWSIRDWYLQISRERALPRLLFPPTAS